MFVPVASGGISGQWRSPEEGLGEVFRVSLCERPSFIIFGLFTPTPIEDLASGQQTGMNSDVGKIEQRPPLADFIERIGCHFCFARSCVYCESKLETTNERSSVPL